MPTTAYPVIVTEQRTASRQALVSYRGNRYSVPPELAAAAVVVSHPIGGEFCDIATTTGIVIARHRMATDGLGVMVRDSGHVIALDAAAWPQQPPGDRTGAKNASHPGRQPKPPPSSFNSKHRSICYRILSPARTDPTVIDLSAYERAAQNRTLQ